MESWLPQIIENTSKERQKHLTVFRQEQRNRELSSVKLKLRSKSKCIEKLSYISFKDNLKWVNLLEGLDNYAPKTAAGQRPKRGLGYRAKPPPLNNSRTFAICKNRENRGILLDYFSRLNEFFLALEINPNMKIVVRAIIKSSIALLANNFIQISRLKYKWAHLDLNFDNLLMVIPMSTKKRDHGLLKILILIY